MHRSIGIVLLAFVWACASTVLASAQVASSPTEASQTQAPSTPVAYIYVASYTSSGKYQIEAYAAASNGSLTAVAGSPFATTVNDIALNGRWLFGTDGNNIDSFSIASNGAIKQVDTLSVETTGGLGNLFLDHTGTSLYVDYYTTNNDYLSYSIDNTNGKITPLNDLSGGPSVGDVLSFIGNNKFGYSASCYHFTPAIYGAQRNSDGSLAWLSINPPMPVAPTGETYCPFLAAADPTNHLAVGAQLYNNWAVAGPYQLAVYTADSSGNLTTSSTYKNMPSVAVGNLYDLWMSPDGKHLAVSGSTGLQVFKFNGANPITKFTGLLTSKDVEVAFWDNANHLYAISRTGGKLYVFTVTSTGVTQAPGSPHSIVTPVSLIVLPKT
jgi:6-phosphogluconolactonase (cycloisomerase 2 family)